MGIKGKEILIIDQDKENISLMTKIFEASGLIVSLAENIMEGMELMQSRAPHIITLELELTNSSGFDFLIMKNKDLRFRQIPVIIVSNIAKNQTIAKALSYGAADYIVKPIKAKNIIQKIRKQLSDFKVPSVELDINDEKNRVDIKCSGAIVQINEISCILQSSVKIPPNTAINIDSKYLDELGASACKMRSVSISRMVDPKTYHTEITFVGVDETIATRIRRAQKQKSE